MKRVKIISATEDETYTELEGNINKFLEDNNYELVNVIPMKTQLTVMIIYETAPHRSKILG